MSTTVGKLALLSRRGDEPMRIRAEIELGTGTITWLPDPSPESPTANDEAAALRIVERIQATLDEAVVHLVGSRRMACALPGADIDLIAEFPAVDLPEIQRRLASAIPEARHIREVIGARVPGLRMTIADLDVDLIIIPADDPDKAASALSAVTDAAAVLDLVGADHEKFARLARQVKAWASARGLDSAPFGGLPGLAWSILAARTVAGGSASLAGFFEEWAAWDWRQPVTLDGSAHEPTSDPVSILTPTTPVRSCTTQVGSGMRDLLVEEFYRGWEARHQELCEPPPLHRRHAAWAVVTVPADIGRARGRMRALISQLEAASPGADIHAWPRLQHVGYVIGLGRTPLDRGQVAEIGERWAKGMPGVSVEWVEGGGVGSLTSVGVFER
jgi:hypothetical protein